MQQVRVARERLRQACSTSAAEAGGHRRRPPRVAGVTNHGAAGPRIGIPHRRGTAAGERSDFEAPVQGRRASSSPVSSSTRSIRHPTGAALASARATLAHAHASVTAARLIAERYQALSEAHAVSRQDYDNAVAKLWQGDEADVASGAAAVRTAEINLAYTKMYSPIGDRAAARTMVTEGALIIANQATSLLTVTQLDPVYVDLTQPSATLVRLKRELAAGQIRHVDGNQAPAKLLLEDGSPYESSGTLEFSEVTVDQGTGSVTLRAIFPNSQGLLLPGMFVRATIEEGVREGAIVAPQQGITHAPDGTATALIVGADGKVEKRSVELDPRASGISGSSPRDSPPATGSSSRACKRSSREWRCPRARKPPRTRVARSTRSPRSLHVE